MVHLFAAHPPEGVGFQLKGEASNGRRDFHALNQSY